MHRIRLTIVLLTIASLVVAACSGAGDDAGSGGESDALAAAALVPADIGSLDVSSPVFTENRPRKRIPKQNTCFGENMSPPLNWSGVPTGAKSLALIAEEPEDRISVMGSYTAVASGDSVHWLVYNMPASLTGLAEGVPTSTSVLPDGTIQGTNDFDTIGYSGPCPPASVVVYGGITGAGRFSSDPPHDYFFRLYALDTLVDLAPGATKGELAAALEGHVLAFGETMGKYQSPRQQGWYLGDSQTPIPNTPTPVP